MQNNKNLFIIQDQNDENIINFYLIAKNLNFDWGFLKVNNFIKYQGTGTINNDIAVPDNNYHCISFDFSNLKYHSLKEKTKEFIEEIFSDDVSDENEYKELIQELIKFFSSAKTSDDVLFINNTFSYLLFIYKCCELNVIEALLKTPDFDQSFFTKQITLTDKSLLKIAHAQKFQIPYNKEPIDYIAVKFKAQFNKTFNVLTLIDTLTSWIDASYFDEIKRHLNDLNPELIKKVSVEHLENIDLLYYDSNDGPEIQIINMNNCNEIFYKQSYTKSSLDDESEFKKLLVKIFDVKVIN